MYPSSVRPLLHIFPGKVISLSLSLSALIPDTIKRETLLNVHAEPFNLARMQASAHLTHFSPKRIVSLECLRSAAAYRLRIQLRRVIDCSASSDD